MFCDRCGAAVNGARFCPGCGKSFAPPAGPAVGRVATHVRTLGILWLVRAGLRLIPALFLTSFSRFGFWWDGMPYFPALMRGIGTFMLISAIAGAIAGWGLLERRAWARMLAIILGALAILDFPVGTALGAYTLWVLAPAASETEYRAIARPV